MKILILAALLIVFGGVDGGMVIGVGDAQARVGRPLTPFSYAGVARRTYRRGAYNYGGYGYHGGTAAPYGRYGHAGCHC